MYYLGYEIQAAVVAENVERGGRLSRCDLRRFRQNAESVWLLHC